MNVSSNNVVKLHPQPVFGKILEKTMQTMVFNQQNPEQAKQALAALKRAKQAGLFGR